MRIAVIGANGFIGRAVCEALKTAGHEVVGIIRNTSITGIPGATEVIYINDAGPAQDWQMLLADIDVALHLASPKSVDKPDSTRSLDYDRITGAGTLAVGEAAFENNLKRMIFVSSIKVNGETTEGRPFTINDAANPISRYAESKQMAESGLSLISKKGLPITIIRPPAVYGPHNTGNIMMLMKLLSILPGRLIPLGEIKNKRSLIFIGNLVSAIVSCVEDLTRQSRLFLVRDPEMLSTSELCMIILAKTGRTADLCRDPLDIFRKTCKFLRPNLASRLYGSLEIDDSEILETLHWKAPFSTLEGLSRTIAAIKTG